MSDLLGYLDSDEMGDVEGIVSLTHGQFFSIAFRKRSDGSYRKLVARTGVKKFLRGGKPSYNPYEKNLIPVWCPASWDPPDMGYRSVPVESVISLKFSGIRFNFNGKDPQ
jgi:hypothetical protein